MRKVGKWAVIILSLAFIYVRWDTDNQVRPDPPNGYITINKEKTEMLKGNYSWEVRGKAVIACGSAPPDAVQNTPILNIDLDSKVIFSFYETPNSSKMNIWDMQTGEMIQQDISTKNLDFSKLKLVSGKYALEVEAKWDKGEASYISHILWEGNDETAKEKEEGYLELTPTEFYQEQLDTYMGTGEPVPLNQVKYEAYVTGTTRHGGFQSMMIYSRVPNGYRQQIKSKVQGDNLVVEIDEKQLATGEIYQEHLVYWVKIFERPNYYKVIQNGKEVKKEIIGYATE